MSSTSISASPCWATAAALEHLDFRAMDRRTPSHHPQLVTDPTDPIRAIILLYLANEIGCAGADGQIMIILIGLGLAVTRKIRPMKVGIHHLNRGGVIGASMEVGQLMDEICDLFWNPAMCIHALCVEIESGDRHDEDCFRSWCAAAEVDLPPVPPGSLEAVALACSHTNCGLRAIDSKCESANPKLGDGSNYDVEVIRKRDISPSQKPSMKGSYGLRFEPSFCGCTRSLLTFGPFLGILSVTSSVQRTRSPVWPSCTPLGPSRRRWVRLSATTRS